MNKKLLGSTILSVLLPCLLLAAGMLCLPFLQGQAVETDPPFRYDVTVPDTSLGLVTPEPNVGALITDVLLLPSVPFSDAYPPEELFWIGHNVEADSLLSQRIPSAASSILPIGRLLAEGDAIAAAAEAINSLSYSRGSLPLSSLKDTDFYVLRYGKNEAVTVYESGYITCYGRYGWKQELALPTQNGAEVYRLLSSLYEGAETHFTYADGVYGFFAYSDRITKPASSLLQQGGRVYIIGDTYYVYPVTREEALLRYTSSSLLVSLTEKDVRYLVDLAMLLRQRNGKAVTVATLDDDRQEVIPLAGRDTDADRYASLRRALFGWLSSLSSFQTIRSVETMSLSDGRVTDAFFREAAPDDFWYFPDMASSADADLLLAHYLQAEDRSDMDFPCFHFWKDGIDYYPSLAQNLPVRLTGSGLNDDFLVIPIE